jgi:hypothetical protein
MGENEAPHASAKTRTIGKVGLEITATFTDEVIADVGARLGVRALFGAQTSALDSPESDAQLRLSGPLGELLGSLAVAVPAEEVHAPVHAGRVAIQNLLDQAHRLEVLAPIERGAGAETGNRVLYRDLGGGLALMLGPDRVFRRHLLGGQVLADCGADRLQAGTVLAHALKELQHEGRVKHRRQGGRSSLPGLPGLPRRLHARHIGVGRPPRLLRLHHLVRQPPQVLDESQLQHARPGPQLADRQRGNGLVAVHEAQEFLSVQATVAVADELHRHGVDAGVARQLPQSELGQLAVVPSRKVVVDVPDLGSHQVEVIEEPFRGRRDELPLVHLLGHGAVRIAQNASVIVEAPKDAPRPTSGIRVDRKSRRQRLGSFFEPLDAQELFAQGLLRPARETVPKRMFLGVPEHGFLCSSKPDANRRRLLGAGRPGHRMLDFFGRPRTSESLWSQRWFQDCRHGKGPLDGRRQRALGTLLRRLIVLR